MLLIWFSPATPPPPPPPRRPQPPPPVTNLDFGVLAIRNNLRRFFKAGSDFTKSEIYTHACILGKIQTETELVFYYLKMQIRSLGALITHLAQHQKTTRVIVVYVMPVTRELAIFVQVITFKVVKYCYLLVIELLSDTFFRGW